MHTGVEPQIDEARHGESAVAAHIDAFEGFRIQRYVDGNPVIARAAANSQADAGKLGAVDIHTGRLTGAAGVDSMAGDVVNDGVLKRHHQCAYSNSQTL